MRNFVIDLGSFCSIDVLNLSTLTKEN